MKRRTFDVLMATAGLFLAVVLIASGVMLTWAHTFIDNEVHTQLAAQQIYFPASNSPAIKAPTRSCRPRPSRSPRTPRWRPRSPRCSRARPCAACC